MKKQYLVYFIVSYVVVGVAARFSPVAANVCLLLSALVFAVPFYKFIKEREDQEQKQEVKEKKERALTAAGNGFTFLGVLLVSVFTLTFMFRVINFVLALIIVCIKGGE